MDSGQELVLSKVLDAAEVESIELPVRKKLEKFYETKISEFFTAKAISETAQKSIETIRNESETKITDLSTRVQDLEAKLDSSQANTVELRHQLDVSRQEVAKFQEHVARNEFEVSECRRDKKTAEEERDSLAKLADRRHIELERLHCDIATLEQQLQAAGRAKCEALAKVNEVESKEVAVDFKEKRLDQEKIILTHQIQSLTEDLHRNISEMQTLRRENTLSKLHLETQLTEKTEELRILRSSVQHLEESNAELVAKAEELTTKLHGQNEETSKIMNHYKKELASKSKLVDMLKDAKMENDQQVNEMASCIAELKKMMAEAADRYGVLETRLKGIDLEHSKDLEEKDQELQRLRDELIHANDLLKLSEERNLEQAVEQLAPTAAASSRLIKSGTSLTEIYSMYVKASEELQTLRKENQHLNLRIRSIIQEVEEKAPEMQKQALLNQTMEETNVELSHQLETLIKERVEAKEEFDNMISRLGHSERECKRLKQSQSDLGLQVCYLIKEIEQMRGGFSSEADQSITSDMSVSEVISKKLVTFSNVQELQENNQKLLHVVRDLSAKLEEIEEIELQKNTASFEAKLASYVKRVEELQHSLDCQTQMMQICMQQRDRYKKTCADLTRGSGRSFNLESSFNGGGGHSDHGMDLDDEDMRMNTESSSSTNAAAAAARAAAEAVAEKEKKIAELEERIKEQQLEMKSAKEEFTAAKREHFEQEKKLNAQFDSLRNEIRDLTASNCKLMTTVEYNNEQIKLQQKNAVTHKRQIQTLEEKSKCYEKIIVKHEHAEQVLRDEVMKVQSELSRAVVQLESLKQENKFLKDAEARVRLEMESLHRERMNQNLLMNNLEMLKASFERSESEGKIRVEERLDQANRECSALRRRLQEEQDHFRVLSTDLERQTATAKKIMEEEVSQVEKVRAELKASREEIHAKTHQIEELSKKLQESLTPSKSDNPIALAQKRSKELELRVSESKIEIEALQKDLLAAKEHAQQYFKLSEGAEAELKELSTAFEAFKRQSTEELTKVRQSEETLKARVEDLETEISLQITKERLSADDGGDTTAQLTRAQTELRDTLQKLSDTQRDLRDSRDQIKSLTNSLQAVEQKYSNEMMAHLNDLESMSSSKSELTRLREESTEVKEARDRAVDTLRASRLEWESREQRLREEVAQLEGRMRDHEKQNAALLDQIQGLSVKLSLNSSSSVGMSNMEGINDSMTADSSLLNRSLAEEDVKSSDQLLQIIKYLRKEKDIAFAKVDVLKSETARLQTEHAALLRQLQESNASLTAERAVPETGLISAAKHEEILRKIETLNAIADSNRLLREERDTLSAKVRELTERVASVEDQLFPLQEKNREMVQKQEEMSLETASLRTEAMRWRQRANQLVEARSKTNPEDFKRLQLERENLAKMLTAEKELLRRANEELTAIRADKQRLDNELANVTRQSAVIDDASKRLQEELQQLRGTNQRLTAELMEVKNNLLAKEEDLKKAAEELTSKDAQLADTKNKENQIRKIAKRYKDSYMELKSKEEGGEVGGNVTAPTAQQVLDLNVQLTSAQEENETLRRENEVLKAKSDLDERSRAVLKEATAKVAALTEAKNTMTKELVESKMRAQTMENARVDLEQQVQGQTARNQRMEKEVADERDHVARLMRENETLTMRLAQLQRQLGMQQGGAKPSTSGGASQSDKASMGESPRTANVKPMASPSHQSATVTPWRANETPLASIRPISVQNRTAAVIPTSQTPPSGGGGGGGLGASGSSSSLSTSGGAVVGNLMTAAVQGTSSTSSTSSSTSSSSLVAATSGNATTALVPPQQQVHSSGVTGLVEVMSSSPTSSHTDYMPATSSATVVAVAAIPPMGSSSSSLSAESTQHEQESSSGQSNQVMPMQIQSGVIPTSQAVQGQVQQQVVQPSSVAQAMVPPQAIQVQPQQGTGQQSQAVALVSPRMETGVQHPQAQQQQQQQQQQQMQQLAAVQEQQLQQPVVPQQHQASSSSSAVTTSQGIVGHKRAREAEGGESSPEAGGSSSSQTLPDKGQSSMQVKRMRVQTTAGVECHSHTQGGGVSESGCHDVEYQVPTSSQRESEYDVIAIDSDDDDEAEAVVDAGIAEVEVFEDEADPEEDGGYDMMVDMGYGDVAEEGREMDEEDEDEDEEEEGAGIDDDDDEDEDNNVVVASAEDNNEVEVLGGDSNERPQQSGGNNSNSGGEVPRNSDQAIDMSTTSGHQQSQTISSGGEGVVAGPSGSEVSGLVGSGGGGGGGGSSSSGALSDESSSSAAVVTQSSQALWRTQQEQQAGASSTQQRQPPLVLQQQAGQNVPGQQQQQQQQQLQQQAQGQGYDETGDDCIVPSTPNLFAPRRHADGFSEAMSSPHPQVPHASRFTFNESTAMTPGSASGVVSGADSGASISSGGGAVMSSGRSVGNAASLVPGGGALEGIDDTQMDLSQLNESGTPGGRTVPTTPKLLTSPSTSHVAVSAAVVVPVVGEATTAAPATASVVLVVDDDEDQQLSSGESDRATAGSQEAVPGTSQSAAGSVPTITVTADEDEEDDEVDVDDDEPESDGTEQQNATTSQQSTSSSSSGVARNKSQDEGTDGVTSEGEKHQSGHESAVEMEEGREAEASLTPTMNTRSRASMQQQNQSPPNLNVGRGRGSRGQRGRTPIVWGDANRGGMGRGGHNMNLRMQQPHPHQQMQMQQPQQMQMQQMQMSPQQIQSFQQQQQMQQQQQQQMPRGGPRGRRSRGRAMGGNFRYN